MKSMWNWRKGDNGNNGVRLILLTGMMVALSSVVSVGSVRAQTETVLAVTPAGGQLWLNAANSVEMAIMISDVVDLQGFDITIIYDPLIVQIDRWDYGEMLSSPATVKRVESPGSFRLAAIQIAGEPASGIGSLVTLTFSGLIPGESAIIIAASALSTDTAETIQHTCQNGAITSAYDPEFLPHYTLTGQLALQGQTRRGGVVATLLGGEIYQVGPYTETSLDQTGANLEFGMVAADSYFFTTGQPRYLNVTADMMKTVTISESETTISPLTLIAGNAIWADNVINVADASLVGACYGMMGADLDADVNFDGVVNLRDLALVAGNYGLDSAAAYQAWMP